MSGSMASLQQDAIELQRLNLLIVKAVAESNLSSLQEILPKYLETKKHLKIRLLESPTQKINDKEAIVILQRLAHGVTLPADNVIAALEKNLGVQGDLTTLDEDEIESLGRDLFYSWFSHYEYIEGLYEIGSLVVSISVPDHLRRFVNEAKNSFAFQQYNAVFSLCRTILESSVRDIYYRRHSISSQKSKVFPIEEKDQWSKLLKNTVDEGQLREQIADLYGKLSPLIHGRKVVSKAEAKEAFESTLRAVHALYDDNKF